MTNRMTDIVAALLLLTATACAQPQGPQCEGTPEHVASCENLYNEYVTQQGR